MLRALYSKGHEWNTYKRKKASSSLWDWNDPNLREIAAAGCCHSSVDSSNASRCGRQHNHRCL
jgi:hypothetical protein